MGSEATYTVGWDEPLFSPLNIDACFLAQTPHGCDLLPLDESAGHIPPYPQSAGHISPHPQSAGDTSHSTIAGLCEAVLYDPVGLAGATAATGAEDQHEQNAHAWFDWTGTGTSPCLTQPPTYSNGNAGRFTGPGMAEIPHSWNPLSDFNMREINAVLNPTAPVNASHDAIPETDPYSTGHTSCCTSTTAADTGSRSLDQEANAGARGLLGSVRLDPIHAPARYCSSPSPPRALPPPPRSRRTRPAHTAPDVGAVGSRRSSAAAATEVRRDPTAPAAASSFPSPTPTPAAAAMPMLIGEPPRRPCPDLARPPPPPGPLTAQTPSLSYGFPASPEPLPPKPAGAGDEGGRELPEMETREEWRSGGAVPRRGPRRRGPRRGLRAPARKKSCAHSPSFDAKLQYERSDGKISAEAGLPQSGSGALTEAPIRESCKRIKVVCSPSSQKSSPEFNSMELLAGLIQSDTTSTDIKPPDGSTPFQIIQFLKREGNKDTSHTKILLDGTYGTKVNLSLGEQDQICPKAVRSYVTTVHMTPDQKPHDLGYWKEKQVENVEDDSFSKLGWVQFYAGLKKTFQFQTYDGTKTNWFMDEYIPTENWGFDLYMERLRYRVVYYKSAEVPGEPTTSPQVKSKNKIAALKHRMRGHENLVIKGESPAWQHFIKIYDRHPEQDGSKVVYAVCCQCEGVLRAGTENGTKSLLTHCNRTCPIKNKNQQPSPT